MSAYILVEDSDLLTFVTRVNNKMEEGFNTNGSLVVHGNSLIQSMTRYSDMAIPKRDDEIKALETERHEIAKTIIAESDSVELLNWARQYTCEEYE